MNWQLASLGTYLELYSSCRSRYIVQVVDSSVSLKAQVSLDASSHRYLTLQLQLWVIAVHSMKVCLLKMETAGSEKYSGKPVIWNSFNRPSNIIPGRIAPGASNITPWMNRSILDEDITLCRNREGLSSVS